MILGLLVRRLIGLNGFSSIIMRHVSLFSNRTRRHSVGVRILSANRFQVRTSTGFGRQCRFTLGVGLAFVKVVGLEGRFRWHQLTTTVAPSSARRFPLVRFGTGVLGRHLLFVSLSTFNPVSSDLFGANHLFYQRLRTFKSVHY